MKRNRFSARLSDVVSRETLELSLLDSVKRLRKITFLGILSPKFRGLEGYPIQLVRDRKLPYTGGNRFSHSLRVAKLAVEAGYSLGFSPKSLNYAFAWGIFHDIATWPLSHTGEAAFSASTCTTSRQLRTMFLTSNSRLGRLGVYKNIREAGLEIETLESIFSPTDADLQGELKMFHQLVHSPVTPDTIDGISRCTLAFEGHKSEVQINSLKFERDFFSEASLDEVQAGKALRFWRTKARVYDKYINSRNSLDFESRWSRSIAREFGRIDLVSTLYISEAEIVRSVASVVASDRGRIKKYKPPLVYGLSGRHKHKTSGLGRRVTLKGLQEVLVKSRLELR